ncbi:F-box/WD repeat-containing protein 5 [Halyomorpha halys]|uniref:F-box/WD repeat-containing protein 5 n=1 Tax=Halyomorpha halys TaxID=286706 RepID=UPI0006D4CC86|nr:F-box/WD repeat-containing protein 5 [Halyomorpha halys]
MDTSNQLLSNYNGSWDYLPDTILLHIFQFLSHSELLKAGLACRNWCRISYDEVLWKHLFRRHFDISDSISIAPGKNSWYMEFKRLIYHTPQLCSEVISEHRNEVLHVSFSHNGSMFATSSKDGFIIVWNSSYPVNIKYSYDMKVFSWKYTQFSQFNKSDTLLLVSGVHFGVPTSTSGEIAVFSLQDGFNLQCRVGNKPYDIFGTWFSDRHLLSGDHYWLAHMVSTTGLWINKASQETASEQTPILNQLFRFYNTNASSVRVLMVADGQVQDRSCENISCKSNGSVTTLVKEEGSESHTEEDDNLSLEESDFEDDDLSGLPEKLLIFTSGSKTYVPHQIGFKRIKSVKFPKVISRGPSVKERLAKRRERLLGGRPSFEEPNWGDYQSVVRKYDEVDHVMDLHGHIIGMSLSPDHRFLYVNNRPWPTGYNITNPLDPPPIAQEIDIHVIDLENFKKVGKVLRSHKAFTPNNECFFIFLNVSEEYVASGAEDKHGYIWDRHYGIRIAKLPHLDVVNSVAFNPMNPEMLVTTSDDYEIKVWRSKKFMNELVIKNNKLNELSLSLNSI